MSVRRNDTGWVDDPVSPAQARTRREDSVPERACADHAIVYIVDDEPSIRNSAKELVESVGLRVQTFATAQDFLASQRPDVPGCLVLDVRLPGLSGLDLQRELARLNSPVPIIFITGHGDIPMTVKAMKAGAVDFLAKPFRHQDLLDAIARALERDRSDRGQRSELAELRRRHESLTPREREVMAFLVKGMLNKQVAAELAMTEPTVKFHRAHVMRKMNAASMAELVRAAGKLIEPVTEDAARSRPRPAVENLDQ
jgi:FixJ family two-component response regulator